MTPSSPATPRRKPQGSLNLSMNRQQLLWLLSVSMFFCVFLGWNSRLEQMNGFSENKGGNDKSKSKSTFNKRFQVNRNHNKTRVVKQISLIGERNSGTKWMWGHLEDCFNHSIPVRKHFSRYKHWFQPKDYWRYPHDTLVVAQFRDPYTWLEAMRATPHHAPAHAGLEWKQFLKKTWTTKRIGLDLDLKGDEMCQHHYQYRDVISCIHKPEPDVPIDNRHSLDKPFYEMRNDGSGLPYDNIIEMRNDKIRDILEIKKFPGVADLWMVQYEYMMQQGTQDLIDRISEWTGITPQCKAYAPQNRPERNMTKEFVHYVTDHLNWTMEAAIGFEPRYVE